MEAQKLETYIERLQCMLCDEGLKGTVKLKFDTSGIDGRSRVRITNALEKAGYITADRTVTPLAYTQIEMKEPDLVKHILPEWDEYILRNNNGVCWGALSVAEKKFVLEHLTRYEFLTPDEFEPHKALRPRNTEDRYYFLPSTRVVDDLYKSERRRRLFELRFKNFLGRNLGWGLVDQAIISTGDEDCFSQEPGFHARRFSVDPARWEAELARKIDETRNTIAKETRVLRVLVTAQTRIQEDGGWEKVIGVYKARLEEELRKKET